MFPEAVWVVWELCPQKFIFENVKGLLRKSLNTYFEYTLLQLAHPEVIARERMDWMKYMGLLDGHHTSESQPASRTIAPKNAFE
jgi:DNA (cytosine-5)-methyltransferase 1